LFGTGNRYGRAIDRVHELTDMIREGSTLQPDELQLGVRQLESAERRTLLIVRALTCFYSAVAGFVASTVVSLIGALMVSAGTVGNISFTLGLGLLTGTIGVCAMISGALMLACETRFSFLVLVEENRFTTQRVRARSGAFTQRIKPEAYI
jgi:hypothetical protein